MSSSCFCCQRTPATHLAFIDGCGEQEVCVSCAKDIDGLTYGMNGVIGLLGSKEVKDYHES